MPNHPVAQALLMELDQPILSTSLILPGEEFAETVADEIRNVLGNQVDLIIDGGICGMEPTTVVSLIDDSPEIVRQGKGDPVVIGT